MTREYKRITIGFPKRLFDIVFSLFVLIVALPFFCIVILVITFENAIRGNIRAPIFYTETRISEGERFTLIKFNIFKQSVIKKMKENNIFIHTKNLEKNGSLKIVGYFLKQIYMDELPQLLNVLKGDMSIVGPRPLNLEVYEKVKKIEFTAQKYLRAGITGNFQSYKGTEGKSSEQLDKEYFNYCGSHSKLCILLFDIKILFRTMKVVLRAKGV